MTDLQIRKTTATDVPALCALVQRSVRVSNASAYAPEIIDMICANFEPDKFLERMGSRDVFTAIRDGEIAGTVSFSLPRSKLYSLFIEPHLQRSGTGQRLVHHIEQHAQPWDAAFCSCQPRSRRGRSMNASATQRSSSRNASTTARPG